MVLLFFRWDHIWKKKGGDTNLNIYEWFPKLEYILKWTHISLDAGLLLTLVSLLISKSASAHHYSSYCVSLALKLSLTYLFATSSPTPICIDFYLSNSSHIISLPPFSTSPLSRMHIFPLIDWINKFQWFPRANEYL